MIVLHHYLGFVWMVEWVWKTGFELTWDESVWKVWLFGLSERQGEKKIKFIKVCEWCDKFSW